MRTLNLGRGTQRRWRWHLRHRLLLDIKSPYRHSHLRDESHILQRRLIKGYLLRRRRRMARHSLQHRRRRRDDGLVSHFRFLHPNALPRPWNPSFTSLEAPTAIPRYLASAEYQIRNDWPYRLSYLSRRV